MRGGWTGSAAAVGVTAVLLSGCTPETVSASTCADLPQDHALSTMEDVRFALDAVLPLQPLDGVSVELSTFDHEQDYFRATVDVSTISDPPRERLYRVEVNNRLLDDPPPWNGVLAILVHETQHIVDYTGMDQMAFAEWALWYASTDDFSAYERATDERSLELGCGTGLAAFRTWLYDHVDDETEAQKRHDYYTPEEIVAWALAQAP